MSVIEISVIYSMDIFIGARNYFAVDQMGRERRRRPGLKNAVWFTTFQWAADWTFPGLSLHGRKFYFKSKWDRLYKL